MIAIETINEEGKAEISLNPGGVKIKNSTVGYFIAQDADEVRRVLLYCKACHENVQNLNYIVKCKCSMMQEKSKCKFKSS